MFEVMTKQEVGFIALILGLIIGLVVGLMGVHKLDYADIQKINTAQCPKGIEYVSVTWTGNIKKIACKP